MTVKIKAYSMNYGDKLIHVYREGNYYKLALFEEYQVFPELLHSSINIIRVIMSELVDNVDLIRFNTEKDIISIYDIKINEYELNIYKL